MSKIIMFIKRNMLDWQSIKRLIYLKYLILETPYMFLMMMMMMNCFCGMVDQQKVFGLISIWDHCQRSSPLWISDTPRAGFKPTQNLSSGFVEWSCAVLITTTPRRHKLLKWNKKHCPKFHKCFLLDLKSKLAKCSGHNL